MSNYRRLISYMYAYEGGIKGKNVGYAKLEERLGQCKIQLNVKNIYVGSRDIGVYLLTQSSEICIGRIFIRGGFGEFRTTILSENIEDSNVSLDECYGLSIHETENSWVAYTTIWEDAVAHAAEVELADVTSENVRKNEEIKENKNSTENIETTENTNNKENTENTDNKKNTENKEEAPWEQEPEIIETPKDETQAPDPEDPELLKELEKDEKTENHPWTAWNNLEKRFVKVQAFKYDNGCEILSVKPQDIGILPRENWIYGNNSFLLHGYYNYRHLILAKLNNPHGNPRFLLGVPGHYYSNEKYMASMFGFPHFVLATNQPQGDERFGYWYTDIRL